MKKRKMDKRSSEQAKERVSRLMTGRVPWNKGIGLEHPSIRRGIKTRRSNKALREFIGLIYAKEEL